MTTIDASAWTTREVLGGRYEVERVLKQGVGATTVLATDRVTQQPVIVKIVGATAVSAGARIRLEHESDVLRRLDSPHLASILDVVTEDGAVLLVMRRASGEPLDERIGAGPVPVDTAIAIGIALFGALAEAHGSGVVHRDVKPANIVVDATDPISVTLVDFGLARADLLAQPIRDLPAGTARYVSPEQAGILHQDVDERADLYSAGAVLFECLAGHPPFDGASVGEVLRALASTAPPRLRTLGIEVPGALDEIIQHLLRKDPRDRYQCAEAVHADLEALRSARLRGDLDPALIIGVHDERRTITEPAFVGRNRELTALDLEVAATHAGHGGLILLEAESGGGKSRLLDELAYRASATGAWVLRGQGLDQAAARPFQMLTAIADEIVSAAVDDAGFAATLALRVGEEADGVRAALPVFRDVLAGSAVHLGPEQYAPARIATSLAALLDALGSEDRPAVVLLDDCQWADGPTLRVLEKWTARNDDRPDRRTMVVAAFRSEEVAREHPLRGIEARSRISLPPFGPADVRGLVESMAGPLPDQAVGLVEELSDGSPFMASAVLRGLVEMGALTHQPSGWEIDANAIDDVQASRRSVAFLTYRLRQLSEQSRRLLVVGAVLGKEFELDLAADLAGQSGGEAVRAVDEARHRHILWTTGAGGRCTFAHDKLREALLDDLEPGALVSLHLRAAERMEGRDPQPIFELGYHFDAAGAPERALPYALLAGDEARGRHALELAEGQYRVARRGAGHDVSSVCRAAYGLGEVLLLQGRYAEAQDEFLAARAVAAGDDMRAEVERQLGEVAFRRGDVTQASVFYEEAHRLMGRHPPRRTLTFAVLLMWELAVQIAHTLRPGRLGRRDPASDKGTADLAAARVYSRTAYAYWFSKGRIPCAWVHLRGLNLVERYPAGPELAQAWSEHAPVMTMVPLHRRAVTYAEKSLAIRERLGDVWGQGQSLGFYGVALYAASDFEGCIDKCQRAVRLLQRTGDQWEINTAMWHIAFSQYRLGQLDASIATAQRIHRTATELGDHQAAGICLGVWAKAAAGDLPAEIVQAALERQRDDVHTSAEVLTASALRLLAAERVDDAIAELETADGLVRSAGLRQEYVSPVVAWLVTAQRRQIEALGPWSPKQRRRLVRHAKRSSRRACRTARWYKNNAPHALREAALLEALRDRPRRTDVLFERSLAVAQAQGARYEEALTLEARGRVGIAAGNRAAAADLERAALIMGQLRTIPAAPDEVPTLSLADRFDGLLDEGRRIAAALTRDDICAALLDAARALLRPQGLQVIDLAGDGNGVHPDGGSSDNAQAGPPVISRTVIEQALRNGRPTSSSRDLIGDPSESMLSISARSIMAAPIFLRGQPIACLYVTHDDVGGLYDHDDERVAQFLTAIAGAALENAEGFAEVQALSRHLEQRVAERTEELATANHDLDKSIADLRVALEREQEVAERLRTLDTLKNEFVAIVAHDLRSPMATIAGAAKTLLDQGERLSEDDRQMFLEMITRNTMGLAGLVEDVLQVARIESGQFSYSVAPFDLGAIVRRTVQDLEVGGGTSITVDDPGDIPLVYGDAERNWQVLTNLLSNAVKFSPKGAPVGVSLSRDGLFVQVTVRDNGTGIAEQDMPRLFQKFSRIRGADVRGRIKGTGLGLYICQRIVEAQGGRIWAESRPGEGSKFIYTIPFAQDVAG